MPRIQVTRDDMVKGAKGDCNACPIARAVGRELPGMHVEVWSDRVVVTSPASRDISVALLPPIAQRFVAGFDTSKIRAATCPTFDFDLTFMDPDDIARDQARLSKGAR
jgi:hypothetical protein